MQAIIDADILIYEFAFAAEAYWKHEHAEREEPVEVPPPWSVVERTIEGRIESIVSEAGAEGKPFLFFTGKNNFRNHLAITHPYKDRESAKPYHYYNVKAYLKSEYLHQEVDWLEADDLLGIAMSSHPGKYICCSRDKDLRQIPGHHFGWEVNNQPQFGPMAIDETGWLELGSKRDKCIGGGSKFFHYQLLVGDSVDTIPGVPKIGAVGAFKLLSPTTTITEQEQAVVGAYRAAYGLNWASRMREAGRLLHMTRERKGSLIKLYSPACLNEDVWMNMETGEFID